MKNALYMLFISLFLTDPVFSLTVISDIDDTIKITNVQRPGDAILRATLGNAAFTGMSETYSALAAPVLYLSGSPFVLEERLETFITTRNFPVGPLTLREPNDFRVSTLQYKVREIESILRQNEDELMLIGDDTQSDHEAYWQIKQKYPERIAGVFIHQIRGIQLPAGIIAFLTGYDLAEALERAGFLDQSALNITKQALMNEKRTNRIIPKFQICPKDYFSLDSEIQSLIRGICKNRNYSANKSGAVQL